MNYINDWLSISLASLMASMIPGISFTLVFRNVLRSSSRSVGVFTALGLSLGMSVYAGMVVFGLAYVIVNNILFMKILRYAGATYLIYIGINCLFSKPRMLKINSENGSKIIDNMSFIKALIMGFTTNILNPKVILFFLALFTQFVAPGTKKMVLIFFGTTSVFIEFIWFSCVATILTHNVLRNRFYSISHWVERCSGVILLLISARLVF